MTHIRVTIVFVDKQQILRILSVCLQLYLSSTQSACTVLYTYYHQWLVWLYNIFPHIS